MERNYYLDGIFGVVTGDALGDTVQFMSRNEVIKRGLVTGMEDGGPFNTPAGTWTDDSAMTLAALFSIAKHKAVNLDDIANNFVRWLYNGEFTPFGKAFDIGGTCSAAITDYANDRNVETCGQTGEYANGNGALMRIMPACLYYYTKQNSGEMTEKEAVEGVISVAKLTHNHLRTNMCNGIYYFIVKAILDDKKNEEKSKLMDVLQKGINDGLRYFGADIANRVEMSYLGRLFYLDELKETDESLIQSSGYVIHTIEAAIWSLINTDSYKGALLKAVNLGDDSDSVGAVTGGLAGLYYGYDDIPSEWISAIQRREWIEELCNKTSKIVMSTTEEQDNLS